MEPASTHVTYHIDTSLIYADEEWNCRGKIQPMHLADLASSIQLHGLQIPIIVWQKDDLPNGCKFLLVAGYRRYFACTVLLRQTNILAIVRTDLTEETARILNFTENLERKDLNILEEAKAIALAFPKPIRVSAVSRALNRSRSWIKSRLLLLELPEEAQQAAVDGLFLADDIYLAHSTAPQYRKYLVAQIIEARKEGKALVSIFDKKGGRRLAVKPKVKDMQNLMLYLLEKHLKGLATKVLLYALGRLTFEEICAYIDNLVAKRLHHPSVQLILEEKPHAAKKHVSER